MQPAKGNIANTCTHTLVRTRYFIDFERYIYIKYILHIYIYILHKADTFSFGKRICIHTYEYILYVTFSLSVYMCTWKVNECWLSAVYLYKYLYVYTKYIWYTKYFIHQYMHVSKSMDFDFLRCIYIDICMYIPNIFYTQNFIHHYMHVRKSMDTFSMDVDFLRCICTNICEYIHARNKVNRRWL